MKIGTAFYVSILSLMLSFGLLITWILKSWNFSVIDSDTFTSTCLALITIAVTLVIGFQIYSAIELKNKINKIKGLEKELKDAKKEYQSLIHELEASLLYSEYDRKNNEGKKNDAILKLQELILKYLEIDKEDIVLNPLMDMLELDILNLNFDTEQDTNYKSKYFKTLWDLHTMKMRTLTNYGRISKKYEDIDRNVNSQIK